MKNSAPDDAVDNVLSFEEHLKKALSGRVAAEQMALLQDVARATIDRDLFATRPLDLPKPPALPQRVQVRVDLVGAKPPIWRRLSLPGDLMLDQVHDALQAAFDWTNSHLHRFAPDDDRYGGRTEAIVTQYDIDEGENGVLETEVQFSQLAHSVGTTFFYTYDFGDDWAHKLVVESIEPLDEADRVIRCVAGKNAAPPEDSGGIHWYEHLRDVAADPQHPEYRDLYEQISYLEPAAAFDQDAVNRSLARLAGASETLAWLLGQDSALSNIAASLGAEARLYFAGFVTDANLTEPIEVTEAEAMRATTVFRILLEHLRGGVQLTAAGYLPPAVVTAIVRDLGVDERRAGNILRESDLWSLVSLREASVALGLARKYRGQFLLTKQGAELRDKPVDLWYHIASRLPIDRGEHETSIATLLLLLVAAGEGQPKTQLSDSLDMMTAMIGLRLSSSDDRQRARALDVVRASNDVLGWVATGSLRGHALAAKTSHMSAARLIARAALQRS